MRIVLQHATSGLYVKAPAGEWTPKIEEALNFGSSQRAIKHLRQQRLTGVQVLVAFVEDSFVDMVTLQLPKAAIPKGAVQNEPMRHLPPAA